MIDATGLPQPDDAPPAGACVRVERPEPGLAVLVLDPPHRRLAVFDVPLVRDLDAALEELEADGALRGLVITGREPLSFAAGADVNAIAGITDEEIAWRLARIGQGVFARIAALSRTGGGRVTTVAAVGGPVPGGACEIALACDRIVLADHPRTRIGLPETQLGILPGWGGCQRLPRRVGIPKALDAILSGRLFRPHSALRAGIVDRLTQPVYLRHVAAEIAMGRMPCSRAERGWRGPLIDRNPLARALIAKGARKQVLARTRGHYPAPLEALALVARAPSTPIERGLEREARALAKLAVSPVCKSLVGIFQLSEDAKKLGDLADGTRAGSVTRGGVIGAGVMGAEIASLMASRGMQARLADLDRHQLDAALHAHRAWAREQAQRRRLLPHEVDGAIDRLEVTTSSPNGFDRCGLVIEAVAEKLAVKRAVLGAIAERVAPDALLATNTSSLSVAEIAAELPHPERVVGIHFFNPVRRMPLVEIVRGPATTPAVVARAARFALDLGKTPVVVADVAGFLVNRILGPYLDEAVRLFEAGAEPERVDRALVAFGMPMGPFELLDEVGLDIAAHAAASLEAAYGERMQASTRLADLVASGELGKKSGRGIYVWETGKGGKPKRAGRNPRFAAAGGSGGGSAAAGSLDEEALASRLVLCMIAEAARALEEDVVSGPRELDLATIFGMGFAPFRGGLLRHADSLGARRVVDELAHLAAAADVAARPGGPARFAACALLVDLAESGGRFHG